MPRSENEILVELRNIECALSPENLSCDGLRPVAETRREERKLMKVRAELIKELGREPTLKELWDL